MKRTIARLESLLIDLKDQYGCDDDIVIELQKTILEKTAVRDRHLMRPTPRPPTDRPKRSDCLSQQTDRAQASAAR